MSNNKRDYFALRDEIKICLGSKLEDTLYDEMEKQNKIFPFDKESIESLDEIIDFNKTEQGEAWWRYVDERFNTRMMCRKNCKELHNMIVNLSRMEDDYARLFSNAMEDLNTVFEKRDFLP